MNNEFKKIQARKKLLNGLQTLINQTKEMPLISKIGKRKIEDPREGITRRYANYIPIARYQYV